MTSSDPQAARRFRDVLGHFPTGVAVITSRDTEDQPIGMAVGSFTSVSLDPPLVAFLPDRGSSTFPAIRESGRFCVNVLGGDQEPVSRAFAMRGADRFESTAWHPAPQTSSPVLDGAVAWIDCEIADIHDAGDHYIVIGRVLDLDVQNPALPLLFFQGGYGTFALRSLVFAPWGSRPSKAVLVAEQSRTEIERLAEDLGLECRAAAPEADGVKILATAGRKTGDDPVGVVLPFFPPFGAFTAAWGSAELRAEWLARFPGELTDRQRHDLIAELDAIRSRGWMLSFRSDTFEATESLVGTIAQHGRTPNLERRLVEIAKQVGGLDDPAQLTRENAGRVRMISAPVIGPEGPIMSLTLHGFPNDSSLEFVERARKLLSETAARVGERFGGTRVPDDVA